MQHETDMPTLFRNVRFSGAKQENMCSHELFRFDPIRTSGLALRSDRHFASRIDHGACTAGNGRFVMVYPVVPSMNEASGISKYLEASDFGNPSAVPQTPS